MEKDITLDEYRKKYPTMDYLDAERMTESLLLISQCKQSISLILSHLNRMELKNDKSDERLAAVASRVNNAWACFNEMHEELRRLRIRHIPY